MIDFIMYLKYYNRLDTLPTKILGTDLGSTLRYTSTPFVCFHFANLSGWFFLHSAVASIRSRVLSPLTHHFQSASATIQSIAKTTATPPINITAYPINNATLSTIHLQKRITTRSTPLHFVPLGLR